MFQFIGSNQQLALVLIPLLAFLESCVGIGLFVSGALLLIVASTALSADVAGLEIIVSLAFAGALLGDHVGFYIGYAIGPRLHHSKFATKYSLQIQRAENLIARFGGLAIFIGRFVPAIRSIVPAVVGISGFKRRLFSLLDSAACFTWAIALGVLATLIDAAV